MSECTLTPRMLPVAVLISGMTASSGEGLAVAFKGRLNTLLFGERTWGASTGIKGYKIDENAFIMVTQSYMTDRKANIYKNGIFPDLEITGGDNLEQPESDRKIMAAIKWLDAFKNRR